MGKKKGEKKGKDAKSLRDIDQILRDLESDEEDCSLPMPLDEYRRNRPYGTDDINDDDNDELLDMDELVEAWNSFYEKIEKEDSELEKDEEDNSMVWNDNNIADGDYQGVYLPANDTHRSRKVFKPIYLYCPQCGKEIIRPDQKTCPACGEVLTVYTEADKDSSIAKKKEKQTIDIFKPGAAGGKTYVIDTNVIIATYGQVFSGLDDNEVVITHTTMEELDKFKGEKTERGYATREAIRYLKKLNEDNGGNIQDGIPVNCGGFIRMEVDGLNSALLPDGWAMDNPDNRILCAAKSLKAINEKTFLITNDDIMTFKAAALPDGAIVQSYHNDIIINEMESPYTGRRECEIGQMQLAQLYRDKTIKWKKDAVENEYHLLRCGTSSALGQYKEGLMRLIETPTISYLRPKNAGQTFALDALLAPPDEIPLVILKGAAGSGKTILAMAAGLDGVYANKKRRKYERVIISRSNTIPEKEDMGFLPGGIEEKMDPLLQPFYYSMKKLITRGEWEDPRQVDLQMEELMSRYVQIQPMAYIRGITVDNSFLIVDEAQNLSIAQIRTLITRMGLGSKLVLLGDEMQIDSPRLSKNTNGLVYAAEKFKGCPMCAQVTFDSEHECIRSPLSAYAVEVL